jgi:hypothetical protein
MDKVEQLFEEYEAARAAWDELIDHPVKTVSVTEYRAMLEAANQRKVKAYWAYNDARSRGLDDA